jgi:hypothetical protein
VTVGRTPGAPTPAIADQPAPAIAELRIRSREATVDPIGWVVRGRSQPTDLGRAMLGVLGWMGGAGGRAITAADEAQATALAEQQMQAIADDLAAVGFPPSSLTALAARWHQGSAAGDDRTAADCADELEALLAGGGR